MRKAYEQHLEALYKVAKAAKYIFSVIKTLFDIFG